LCPELDDEEIELLESLLDTMADNVISWESDYIEEQTIIEMYKDRYEYSYNAFVELVK